MPRCNEDGRWDTPAVFNGLDGIVDGTPFLDVICKGSRSVLFFRFFSVFTIHTHYVNLCIEYLVVAPNIPSRMTRKMYNIRKTDDIQRTATHAGGSLHVK